MQQNILRAYYLQGVLWAILGNKADKYTCSYEVYNLAGQVEDKP